jgi:ubiquinone/menaquinone biosynthesis C-methylase UbiE
MTRERRDEFGVGTRPDPSEQSALTSNRRSYDAIAEQYARRWNGTQDNEALEQFSRLAPCPHAGARVLDAACGSGSFLSALSTLYSSYVGLDISRGMLYEAARVRQAVPSKRVGLVEGDTAALPFCDESFNAIWYCAGLVHTPPNQLSLTMREMTRVLARGGVIYLSYRVGLGTETRPEGRVFFYYQRDEVQDVLAHSGLAVVRAWTNRTSRSTTSRGLTKTWNHIVARRSGVTPCGGI